MCAHIHIHTQYTAWNSQAALPTASSTQPGLPAWSITPTSSGLCSAQAKLSFLWLEQDGWVPLWVSAPTISLQLLLN